MATGRTVEEMRVVLDAETARLHRKLSEADRRMAQFARDTEARLKRFDGYFRSAGASVAALTAGLGVGQIRSYADAWTRVERGLRGSEDIFGMRLHTAEQLTELANSARIDLEAYTKTYQRTAAAIRDYGMGATEAAKMTSSLSMALKLGGATTSEQASVLLQFSQALNKGKLDGDEFRTVMEAAPVVVELLAERLKVGKGEIINFAKEGKLKIKDLVGAMIDGGAKIERIFLQAPVTIEESFTVLGNAMTRYVGRMDEATGASRTAAGIIGGLARNFDTAANSALVLSAALLSVFGPRMIAGVAGFGVAATAALGPLGLVSALLGGGAAAIQLFGDKVDVTADGMVSLKDTAAAVIDVVGGKLTPMITQAGVLWQQAVAGLVAAMSGVGVNFEHVLGHVRNAVNAIIGVTVFAAKSIIASFATLPAAVGEMFIDMANGIIGTVETMVRGVAKALAMIPGIKLGVEVDLGRITNPLTGSGTAAREAMAAAGRELGRDFVGEFGASLDGIGAEIATRAREIAEARRWLAGTTTERAIEMKRGKPPVDQDLIDKMKKAAEQVQDTYRQALEATGRYREAVTEEFNKELAKFTELQKKKLISQEQFNVARNNLAVEAAKKMNEAAEKEFAKIKEYTDVLANGMEKAFDSFLENGKFSFKDFARSILQDLAKVLFKMAVIQPLLGGGNSGTGLLGSLLGYGSTVVGGAVSPRAAGGPVVGGQMYLVGERGPELFRAPASGRIMSNAASRGLVAAGSQERPVNRITVNNNAGAEVSFSETAAGLVMSIERRMDAKLRAFDRAMPTRLAERGLRA